MKVEDQGVEFISEFDLMGRQNIVHDEMRI